MHDPVGVCAILFREFGPCPFGDKIHQYLRFNGPSWFICDVEWEELDGPLGNPARGNTVVYYVVEWYFKGHRD